MDAAIPSTLETKTVLCEREGAIVKVTLNRPDARNALNLDMCLELRRTFEELDADDTVHVILLAARGSVFCAGADLKERQGRDAAWVRQRRLASFAAYDAIERCSRPVIAVAQGPVVGSGGEICMSCDFVVASTAVTFRFPEPQWGTVGATQRLQRVIGKRRAKELLFTGRAMPVEEAMGLGLVARVAEPAHLETLATEIAAAIAKAPPLAMRLTKQAIDLGEEHALSTGLRIEMAVIERNLADDGWRKGIESFAGSVGARAGDD